MKQFSMIIFMTTLVLIFKSESAWGAKPPPEGKPGKQIFQAKIRIPEGFYKHPASSLRQNLILAQPFDTEKDIHAHERYVNSQYPFTSIVILTYDRKFDEAITQFEEQALLDKGLKVIHREKKTFGKQGVLLQVRQYAQHSWFRKWLAIFGSNTQTTVVVAVFPESRLYSLSDWMRRLVEHAALSDILL